METLSPAVQLLHLLDGVGAGQALGGRGARRPLPRGGPVHMVYKEDPPVAVDPSLPVWKRRPGVQSVDQLNFIDEALFVAKTR